MIAEPLTPAEPMEAPVAVPLPGPARNVARAAAIVSLGSGLSRLLGVVRESVKAYMFGATAHMSAFEVAATVPSQLYDLLVGGMVSSALVPVFSEYIARDDYDELWRLASALLTFAVVALLALLALLELGSAALTGLLASGLSPDAF